MITKELIQRLWDDFWVAEYWVNNVEDLFFDETPFLIYISAGLVKLNFWFLWVALWAGLVMYYAKRPTLKDPLIISVVDTGLVRLWLLCVLGASCFVHVLTMWSYFVCMKIARGFFLYNDGIGIPLVKVFLINDVTTLFSISPYFHSSVDFFGLFLVFIAYVVGFVSVITMGNQYYWRTVRLLIVFAFFLIVVYLFAFITHIVGFFILYECLLLPSFLLARWTSPSRRSVAASTYFVVWTQIGSLFVLAAVVYIINISSVYSLSALRNVCFTETEVFIIYALLFVGFGIKVPIWPFHYWLTKTHVEAASGFSMFLSGFLVKTAVFGFYRITSVIITQSSNVLFVTILIIGIVDASIKMWAQTDLKKLVAYCTIQEMNIIFLVFCWGDTTAIFGGVMFIVMHALLSSLMFYLVDCIYVRFGSRSITEVNGIFHTMPKLSFLIILMCVFYAGMPGTLKFSVEFIIFSGLIEFIPISTFVLLFVSNFIGMIGFHRGWFGVLFGLRHKSALKRPFDIRVRDVLIATLCFGLLIALIWVGQWIF